MLPAGRERERSGAASPRLGSQLHGGAARLGGGKESGQAIHRFGVAEVLRSDREPTEAEQELLKQVFSQLPSDLRTFYVKSFQSLLFNKVLQWRIQKYGAQVVPGDLCLVGKEVQVGQGDESLENVVLPLWG